MQIRAVAFASGVVALSLGGCVVGPNFRAPPPPQGDRYTPTPLPAQTASADGPGGDAQRYVEGLDVAGRWWTLYQSPALDALVDQALRNNPDLQAADAALRVAREAYYAQRGALLPTVGLDYNANRQKVSDTIAPPLASNTELYTLHTTQLTISYAPDVFGGLKRQVESAKAQATTQRFQTEATYSTLIANLVTAAIQAASLNDQIAATRAVIQADTGMLESLRRQFAAGEAARGDVAAQAAILTQAEQTLAPLERQLAQQADLIAALTGRYPQEAGSQTLQLADLTLPKDLPLSVPSKLVAQRPDVRAAEASLHAASAQIGVAIANRLPNITLTAAVGGAATQFTEMFSHGNDAWSLTGDILQPIFQGGTLKHRQRGAEAAYAQAQAQYRSSVLGAFQDVADTLQALDADARAAASGLAAEHEALEGLEIARHKFALGEVNRLAVLGAEQTWQQARLGRVQVQAARYADTAALFQALGGGWWNRNETRSPAD